MRISPIFAGLFALIVAVERAPAQDAQEILRMSARLYADAPAYSAEVDSRLIQLFFTPTAAGKFAPPEVNATQYRRLQLKVRKPYGYWLSVQLYMDGVVANTTVASSVITRTDDKLPKQGIAMNGTFVVRDMPAEQFNAAANSRLGDRASEDVVLRYFQSSGPVPDNEHPLGLSEPDLIGSEALGGQKAYRIIAKTAQGEPITLWIDKESLMVVRSIVQRVYPTVPDAAAPAVDGIRKIIVLETLYKKQQLVPTFSPTDFAVGAGPGSERATPDVLGFKPVPEMVKLAEIAPSK